MEAQMHEKVVKTLDVFHFEVEQSQTKNERLKKFESLKQNLTYVVQSLSEDVSLSLKEVNSLMNFSHLLVSLNLYQITPESCAHAHEQLNQKTANFKTIEIEEARRVVKKICVNLDELN